MALYHKEVKFSNHPSISLVIEDTPDLQPELSRFVGYNSPIYIKTGDYSKSYYKANPIEREAPPKSIEKLTSPIQRPGVIYSDLERGLFNFDTTRSNFSKAAENHNYPLTPVEAIFTGRKTDIENKSHSKKLLCGDRTHGISRHSPYGTRFVAEMPDGEIRESFVAGDLLNRKKLGKRLSKISLVIHEGEAAQLKIGSDYLKTNNQVSAGKVLDHLVEHNLDINYRKNGIKIARADASNFLLLVAENKRNRVA